MLWSIRQSVFEKLKLLWVSAGIALTFSQTAYPSIITNLRRTRGTEESKSAAVWAYYLDPAATEVTQALCPYGLDWAEYNQYTCRQPREQVSFRDFFGAFGDPDFGTEHLRLLEQKNRLEKGLSVTKLFSDDLKTDGKAEDRALATGLVHFYDDATKFNTEAIKEIDRSLAAHLKAAGRLADLYRALIDKQPHPMRANHEGEENLRFFVRQFPRSFEKAVTLKGNSCAQEIPGKVETRQGGCWFSGTNTVYGRVERGAHRYDTLNWTVEGGVAHCASVNQGGVWGWRPPTARELIALVEARVAPLFVRGPEINHYFVTVSEQTLEKTRSKREDLGGYREGAGSETALVGTMPGSNLDPPPPPPPPPRSQSPARFCGARKI